GVPPRPPPQQASTAKQNAHSQNGSDCPPPIATIPNRSFRRVKKGVEIGRARYDPRGDQTLLDAAPALRVRIAERDFGVTGEVMRDLSLVTGKAGRVGHCCQRRQFGDNSLRESVRMLQGIPPAPDRSLAKALNQPWVVFRETLQRKEAVAVIFDAIAGRVERLQRKLAFS